MKNRLTTLARLDALMQLGGLIGEVSLTGPALAELWPALWFGQWTHVGQGTAFGLGGYRIAVADHKLATAD